MRTDDLTVPSFPRFTSSVFTQSLTAVTAFVERLDLPRKLGRRFALFQVPSYDADPATLQKSNSYPLSGNRPHQTTIQITQDTHVDVTTMYFPYLSAY